MFIAQWVVMRYRAPSGAQCALVVENISLLTELICRRSIGAINISPLRSENSLRVLHCAYEFRQGVLRVAIKHSRHRLEEERVLES